MKRRRGREPSLAGNPVLVGALTVLVTLVAVTFAYNATNGLPFVPVYSLHVQATNAEELAHGDDVTMGGSRIGVVRSVTASHNAAGRPIALLNVNLKKTVEPLPVNSTFTIRLKGAIGLKYLQVTLGHGNRNFPNGATVPVSQTSSEVDFDQVLSMFTPPTRVAVAASTVGFGTALAGRGGDLNNAIGAFLPLFADLGPVTRNLAAPRTDLAGFFRGLGRYSDALVPVAQAQGSLFVGLDLTFRALASVAVPSLQNTISLTPPLFRATIAGSPVIRPFLVDTAALLHELQPSAATLPQNAPVLADAFAIGTRNLPGTAALDQRTVVLTRKLASFGETPSVQQGLNRLTLTLSSLGPPLAFLTPAQTSCNYVTLFLRNTQNLLSEHVSQGAFLRFVQVSIADQPGFESVPSSRPYTGPAGTSFGPLHVDPYPNTNSPGQTAECSAGNEPYPSGHAVIGNPAGNVGLATEQTKRSGG